MDATYRSLDDGTAKVQHKTLFSLYCLLAACVLIPPVVLCKVNFFSAQPLEFQAKYKPPPPPPYLSGWSRACWVTCTTLSRPCPLKKLDTPSDGCPGNAASNQLLLTADGLSSPHVRRQFQHILRSGSHNANNPAGSRVVLVLDAAYRAYDAYIYCQMRKAELTSLGVSATVCVLLDPAAREDLWHRGRMHSGQAPYIPGGQSQKEFGEEMLKINDDYILQELNRAVAVWVDVGDPLILAQQFRRSLNLSKTAISTLPASQKTMKDIIRAKMMSGAFAYVGVSSGASLAGEHMIDMPADYVRSLGGDNSGLGLVPNCSFFPHAASKDASLLRNLAQTYHTGVMALPACEPVINTGSADSHLSHICP